MPKVKQWLCLILTLVLSTALILPAYAADPLANSFAAFLIDAADTDAPEMNLHVELYRRDETGAFQASGSVRYNCSVNRVAGQASFYIQPQVDGVWVEVDYLTDLDGNGTYEMLDGQSSPVSDTLTADGQLTFWNGTPYSLTCSQTYVLSADTLTARARTALRARNTSTSGQALPSAGVSLPDVDTVLYLVTLHYPSSADQKEYTLCYYLRLFDTAIVPSDVPYGAWYYAAVEYTLAQGFIAGTGTDSFSPNGSVTRAQLAQILWRLGGSQQAESVSFSDVSPSDWFYTAVSWCCQEGLINGTDSGFLPNRALTREELALVLRQYAQNIGSDVTAIRSLTQFTDGSSASVWARDSLGWAVANGLLSGYDGGSLRPGSGMSRAELAVVLRNFCQNVLEK